MKVAGNNLGWREYFRPTPKNIQRMGDALVALSLFATGYAVIMESKIVAIIFIALGAIGTFGQKFFYDPGD